MKLDLLGKWSSETGDQERVVINRGHVNGILIVGSGSLNNSLTLKLRGKRLTNVLANRLNFGFISSLSDQDYGMDSALQGVLFGLVTELGSIQNGNTGAAITAAKKSSLLGTIEGISCFYLPLGSLNLSNQELEVVYDHGGGAANTSIYGVSLERQPDNIIQYDEIQDDQITLDSVRKLYISAGTNLVDEAGVVKDLDVQIDVEDEGTLLFDSLGMIAATRIFTNTETLQDDYFLKIFEESDVLPAKIRAKMTYSDGAISPSIIAVREIIPETTSDSTVENARRFERKIQKLERTDPSAAKNYRHAGLIPKAKELKATIDAVSK